MAALAATTTSTPSTGTATTTSGAQQTSGTSARSTASTAAGTATSKATTALAPHTTPQSGSVQSQQTQQTTVTQPAPAGSSEAYAADVGSIVAVSHTKASASGDGESSTANPLEIGGKPPAAAFGGTSGTGGHDSGALLDTGSTPLGRLAIAPWTTSNSTSASGNSASGLADILVVDLGGGSAPQVVSLRVLQSQSHATWTPAASTGDSSSDGAILDVGGPSGLALDVLHSQANSSGAGSSYLVSVNGNQIGSSSQANGKCALSLPGILDLSCLTASGGTGSGGVLSSAGGVASATIGPASSGLTAALIQSKSASAKAPAAVNPPATSPGASAPPAAAPPAAAPAASAPPAAQPATAAPAASGRLPMTGGNIVALLAAALLLGVAGMGIVMVSRRPGLLGRR